MNDTYDSVLRRLREERERRNLTQRLLCYSMKIQQSHFSRAETGQRRFSYHELARLCNTDVDVLYVFTGKRLPDADRSLELQELSLEESLCLLSTVYSLARFTWSADRSKTSFGQIQQQLEYIQCGIGNTGIQTNIFLYMRNCHGYTQKKMADSLGVDIKKLRELEKGRLLPDSELIWKMYDIFHVSPAFILKDAKGLLSELNYLLNLTANSDREILLLILENEHRLIHGSRH